MSPRRNSFVVERDHKGRERLVIRRRSSSHERGFSRGEQIIEAEDRARNAEDRARTAEAEFANLQHRLSIEQRNVWNLQRQLQQVTNDHAFCQRLKVERDQAWDDIDILKEDIEKVEHKYDKLDEKYRLMKRGISHHGHENETYRLRYEEKAQECELLRTRYAEKDDLNRLNEGRIAEKNRALKDKNTTIEYLKGYLRTHGFRVEG